MKFSMGNDFFYKRSKFGWSFLGVPNSKKNSFKIIVLVKVGSKNENKENFGVAHFLEHMSAKSTKTAKNSLELSRRIDKIGGEFNASTSFETTLYYDLLPANKLRFGIFDLKDRICDSVYQEKDIEIEKGVILEEYNMYEDDPQTHVYEAFLERIFGKDTGLGHKILGTKETIKSINKEKLINFKNSFYSGENILIGAIGKFNPEKTFEILEEEFRDFFAKDDCYKEISEKEFLEDIGSEKIIALSDKKTEQTHFVFGFRTKGRKSKEKFIYSLISKYLGGTMSSRLFREIREKLGLAYYIGSSSNAYENIGSFVVYAGVEKSSFLKALEKCLLEIKKLKEGKISKKDLSISKSNSKGALKILLDSESFLWNFYADQYIFSDDKIYSPKEVLEIMESISVDDVAKVSNEIFSSRNFYLSFCGDKSLVEKAMKVSEMII